MSEGSDAKEEKVATWIVPCYENEDENAWVMIVKAKDESGASVYSLRVYSTPPTREEIERHAGVLSGDYGEIMMDIFEVGLDWSE